MASFVLPIYTVLDMAGKIACLRYSGRGIVIIGTTCSNALFSIVLWSHHDREDCRLIVAKGAESYLINIQNYYANALNFAGRIFVSFNASE